MRNVLIGLALGVVLGGLGTSLAQNSDFYGRPQFGPRTTPPTDFYGRPNFPGRPNPSEDLRPQVPGRTPC